MTEYLPGENLNLDAETQTRPIFSGPHSLSKHVPIMSQVLAWPPDASRQAPWSPPSGAAGAQNRQHDGATASLWERAQKAGASRRGAGGGGRLSEEAERRQRHQEHSDGESTGSLGRRCGSEAADQPRSTSDGCSRQSLWVVSRPPKARQAGWRVRLQRRD